MSPFRPYRPKATATAAPWPASEARAARSVIVRHLRATSAALSAQQVEYLVAFLVMAAEAEAAGAPDDRAVVNALRSETL